LDGRNRGLGGDEAGEARFVYNSFE
jgi:hypothetical protein